MTVEPVVPRRQVEVIAGPHAGVVGEVWDAYIDGDGRTRRVVGYDVHVIGKTLDGHPFLAVCYPDEVRFL